jgi:uncharacterized membrane protein
MKGEHLKFYTQHLQSTVFMKSRRAERFTFCKTAEKGVSWDSEIVRYDPGNIVSKLLLD